jgi:hypothetical protein
MAAPKRKTNSKSDLYVQRLGPNSWGVFLKTYLLKKFKTEAAAKAYITSVRAKAKKNPLDPIGTFANITVGLASAMQINDMLKKKKPVKRKTRVAPKTNGRTPAKVRNPHDGDMPSGARFNEKLFDQDLSPEPFFNSFTSFLSRSRPLTMAFWRLYSSSGWMGVPHQMPGRTIFPGRTPACEPMTAPDLTVT